MTRDEFNQGMQKILVFYHRPTSPDAIEDFRVYMDALYGLLYEMRGDLFPSTCHELAKTLARGQKPMASQFWAVYHRLSEALALKTPDRPPVQTSRDFSRYMLEMATSMSPKGAQYVLDYIGKRDLKFPEHIVELLVQRSTEGNQAITKEVSASTASSTIFDSTLNSIPNY